jgi:hypothetical protein
MTQGYPINNVIQDDNGRGTFQFHDEPALPDLVLEFFNRKKAVEPLAYLDQVKSLKGMLKHK